MLGGLTLGLSLTTHEVQSQDLFNKLVEQVSKKASSASTTGTLNSSDQKLIDDDKADASLEQRQIKTDKRNIGGIYYFNVPFGAISLNTEGAFGLAKVLVEYDDSTGVATLWSRHGFEANDPAKLVPKAQFTKTSTYKDRNLRALQNSTHFLLNEGNAESRMNYKYGQMSYRTDLQGNEVADKLLPTGIANLLLLEPGILYIGESPFAGTKTKADGHNLLRPGMVMPLLVKAGKEEAAKAWTAEKIVQQYRAASEAFDKALEDTAASADPNLTLREPSTDLPTKAELEGAKAQWQILIKSQAVGGTQSSRSFKLVYSYPATAFETQSKKQWVNNSYVDTIISRSRVYVAVFTDQDGKYWTNRFYLVEKAPAGEFFGRRWAGNYEYALPASALPVAIEKTAALKYQAAAKTR